VIVLGLIAGCGRFGFDPIGSNGDDTGDDGGVTPDVAPTGDGGSADAYYITGGSASASGPLTSISTMTGPLTDANMVLVVAIHWRNATSTVTTVQDTFGNGFSMVGSMTRYNAAQSQITWFKKVSAGTTINVFFDQPAVSIDLKWAVYRNIDQASPIAGMLGEGGTSAIADSGALSIGGPAVLVASSASRAADASAGPGYTGRHRAGGGVLEDRTVGPGAANATAMLTSSNDWIIQLVALRPL
jgi:hypothetical protein